MRKFTFFQVYGKETYFYGSILNLKINNNNF